MTETTTTYTYTWVSPPPRPAEPWHQRFGPTFMIWSYRTWGYKILVDMLPAGPRAYLGARAKAKKIARKMEVR